MEPNDDKPVKRDFDKDAATWDENPARVRLAEEIARSIRAHVKLSSEMEILDFGCGTGLVTFNLAKDVRRVIAMDSSQGMLDVLSAKAARGGFDNVETCFSSDGKLGGMKAPLHLIVSSMTLHHIQYIEPFFRQCFAALCPGGAVAIADLDKEDGSFHPDNTGVFHFGFDRSIVESALVRAGFVDARFYDAAAVERPTEDKVLRRYPIFLVTADRPRY